MREPTKAVGMMGILVERKMGAVQEKNKPSGEGESPCKHRANVHLRRSQGRKPLPLCRLRAGSCAVTGYYRKSHIGFPLKGELDFSVEESKRR